MTKATNKRERSKKTKETKLRNKQKSKSTSQPVSSIKKIIYDYYAFLDEKKENYENPDYKKDDSSLISGFIDKCTVFSSHEKHEKNEAREFYRKKVSSVTFPKKIKHFFKEK